MRGCGEKAPCRLLAILLVCCLLLPQPAALAADGEEITVTIGTGIPDQPKAEVAVRWDDGWFTEDAAVYRQDLALAAMALSGAAYAWTDRGLSVRSALRDMGFKQIRSNHYQIFDDIKDKAAYTFAVKTMPGQAGTRLVAVVVRGTGDYMEWAGNLEVGAGGVHQGFAKAADELLENLEKYLAQTVGEGAVRFLVTGHSRGGAVANLTAARLVQSGLAAKGDVYGYTFAAPAVSVDAAAEGYGNIFNIINQEDLVPQVPLAAWGYRRYGVDCPLPVERDAEKEGKERIEEMERQFTVLTGQSYAFYQDAAAVEKLTAALYRLIPSVSGGNMAMISALLRGDFEGLAGLIGQNGLGAVLLGRTAVQVSSELAPLLRQEQAGLRDAHCMAGYYSWLAACPPAWRSGEEAEIRAK